MAPAPAAGEAAAVAKLGGRVRVVEGERPVVGASVIVRSDPRDRHAEVSRVTDADGYAKFDGEPVRGRPIFVLAEGLRTKEPTGWAKFWEDEDDCTVVMVRGVPVDGRVIEARNGQPIAGATVRVSDQFNQYDLPSTGKDGRFHVTGVTDDNDLHLSAQAPGFARLGIDVRVDGGKVIAPAVELRLPAGGSVSGVVRTRDGAPVPFATVRVTVRPKEAEMGGEPAFGVVNDEVVQRLAAQGCVSLEEFGDPQFHLMTVADAGGAYRIEGLSFDESYDVKAIGSARATTVPVDPLRVSPEAPSRRADLVLRRTASVIVRLVVPAATTAKRKVRLVSERGSLEPAVEPPDGRYVFDDIDPDVYVAFASVDGLLPNARRVDIGEGEHRDVELTLERGVEVEGIVVDLEGTPMSGASVRIATGRSRAWKQDRALTDGVRTESDADGRFTFRSLRPGECLIAATTHRGSEHETREPIRITAPARALRVVVESIGGVRVRLLTPDGQPFVGHVLTSSTSDSFCGGEDDVTDGRVSLRLGLDGEFDTVFTPEGYAWLSRPVHVLHGEWIDLGDVVLDPGVTISGTVIDRSGHPVEGADLYCVGNFNRRTKTGANGSFELARFPRTPTRFSVSHDDFVEGAFDVDPSKTSGLEFRLTRFVAVRGVVTRGAGVPSGKTYVELRLPGAKQGRHKEWQDDGTLTEVPFYPGSYWLHVDPSGTIQDGVGPGTYVGIWVDPAGVEHRVGEWTFVEDQPAEIEVTLSMM